MIFYWTTISLCLTLTITLVWLEWWKEKTYYLPTSVTVELVGLDEKLDRVLSLLGVIMSDQEHLNADVAALVAAAASIADEIAALKAQPAAAALDFTNLDGVVSTFQGLVPAPAPAPVVDPVPAPAPVVDPGNTGGVDPANTGGQ